MPGRKPGRNCYSAPPALRRHELGEVRLVGGEPGPRLFELVGALGAAALSLVRPHGHDGIDGPGPILGSAAAVLNPDRADLDLVDLVLQDDAIIVVRLGVRSNVVPDAGRNLTVSLAIAGLTQFQN